MGIDKEKQQNRFEIREGRGEELESASKQDLQDLEDKLKDDINSTKDKLTINFITVLGIFASILAFLLIEVQIIKDICSVYKIIGLSLIFVFGIVLFVLLLKIIVDNKSEISSREWVIYIILLGILIASFYCFNKSEDEYTCRQLNIDNKLNKTKDEIRNDMDGINLKIYDIEGRLNDQK